MANRMMAQLFRSWRTAPWLLLAIIVLASALRLWNIAFGLPAFYDPDEAMFMLKGIELIINGTLNPGWFGHPGSTTIYTVAVIEALVAVTSILSGAAADADAFVASAYRDPTPLVLSVRIFIFLCAIACIVLTYALGKQLFSKQVGLMAAFFLSINSLNIQQSQIVRTDIHATLFLLLALIFAVRLYRTNNIWAIIGGGLSIGFACATKWPVAIGGIALLAAAWRRRRDYPDDSRRLRVAFALIFAVALAGLFAASPYIFFDYPTVLRNLTGEVRESHPGSTGFGLLGNIYWYGEQLANRSLGIAGLLAALLGAAVIVWRHPLARATIGLFTLVFALAIAVQPLIWERWLIPLLPTIAIFMAVGVAAVADWLGQRTRLPISPPMRSALLAAALAAPMLLFATQHMTERANDTRQLSSAWALRHIPKGSSVLIEYFAFDFINEPWTLLFPAGKLGCVDVTKTLQSGFSFADSEDWRGGRSIVDISSINADALPSCQADYLILTNFWRYQQQDQANYRNYARLIASGQIVRHFKPEKNVRGGPEILIVRTRTPLSQ